MLGSGRRLSRKTRAEEYVVCLEPLDASRASDKDKAPTSYAPAYRSSRREQERFDVHFRAWGSVRWTGSTKHMKIQNAA